MPVSKIASRKQQSQLSTSTWQIAIKFKQPASGMDLKTSILPSLGLSKPSSSKTNKSKETRASTRKTSRETLTWHHLSTFPAVPPSRVVVKSSAFQRLCARSELLWEDLQSPNAAPNPQKLHTKNLEGSLWLMRCCKVCFRRILGVSGRF